MVFCWLSRGRGKEEQEEKEQEEKEQEEKEQEEKEQEEKEQEEEEQRKFKTFNLERLPINDDHYRSFSSSQTPSPCTRHRGVHSAGVYHLYFQIQVTEKYSTTMSWYKSSNL